MGRTDVIEGRVLVADDEAHTRTLLRDLFESWGFVVRLAQDGEQTLEALHDRPDLLVLDLMMPKVDGFQVLKELRSRPATADLPVIILTAIDDVEGRLKAVELGADDYLSKPFRIGELRQRIDAVFEKRRERVRLGELPRHQTGREIDSLARLREDLEREIDQAQRAGRPLSALIVSIDEQPLAVSSNLRPERLRDLAELMRRTFRESDRVFRLDTEAFVVLMPEADREGAAGAAERLVEAVRTLPAGEDAFTVSAGIADFPRWGVERPDELVWAAHRALRRARKTGPSRVEVAPDPAPRT